MLSTSHKAHILQRAGIAVPPAATTFLLTQVEREAALARWESTIENLFITYAMARAQQSLTQCAVEDISLNDGKLARPPIDTAPPTPVTV